MADLKDLHDKLVALVNGVDDKLNVVKVAAATAIIKDLTAVTPVDTSQAISNWRIGINGAPVGIISPLVPGTKGSSYAASVATAVQRALQILSTVKAGEAVWISNNLPYITSLNQGSSAQAPAGFVERAALIGRKIVQTAIL